MFAAGAISLVYSAEIIAEYEDVLFRPHLRIPRDEADTVMAAIRQYIAEVFPAPSAVAMIDEDDRIFYETAKSAKAFLVTGNTKHYPS